MRAVAKRFFLALLASAETGLPHHPLQRKVANRLDTGAFVRTIAERLLVAEAASTPGVGASLG